MEKGIPFIVSAPSGAGKTTLCRKAVDFFPDLRHSISYTTRRPRPGEKDGVDYWFVSDDEFERMRQGGEFVESAEVHGRLYGTSGKDLETELSRGSDVILDIDVQGAEKIKGSIKNGVYIFIVPPSVEECEERLRKRSKDSPGEIKKRLRIALEEIKKASQYDYIIINEDLDKAFGELKSIITAERTKKRKVFNKIKERFSL